MSSNQASPLRALLLALALLTRLPVARLTVQYQPGDERLAVVFYPLVGLILGGILWIVALGVGVLPAGLAAALLLGCWILLTGAMHLDGLADTTDAYFAGHRYADAEQRRERVLKVMRDPSCGPMAVVVLVMLLITKWAALTALFELSLLAQPQWLPVLLLLPRAALLPYVLTATYARPQGLARALAGDLPQPAMYLMLFASVGLTLLLVPWLLAGALLLAAALITGFWRYLLQALIGGYTGDSLGALIELLELALLILLIVAARFWL